MATKKTALKQVATVRKPVDAKVQQTVAKELKLLNDIANKSKKIMANMEDALYARLRETYVLYYKWMSSKNKAVYIEALDEYLDERKISHNAATSEALKMTKVILGEENIQKASKYGNHMDTAYRKGITPQQYSAWMEDNGIEAVSRKKPLIKGAKKVAIDEISNFKRASPLVHKWLEIRQALPIASGKIEAGSILKYGTLSDEKFTNTQYEFAICKRTKGKNGKDDLDTLWLLPKTVTIEKMFMHQLARAIYKDLPNLEKQMKADELKVMGDEIEQLMLEDEIYQFAYEDDQLLLQQKLYEAQSKGLDTGLVYASHKFVKPKLPKRTKAIVQPNAKLSKPSKTKKPTAPLIPKHRKANAKAH
jgi:hypothetical protein